MARYTTFGSGFYSRSRSRFGLAEPAQPLEKAVIGAVVPASSGVALVAFAWIGPNTSAGTEQRASENLETFSHQATMPLSAAYQSTTVTSPDPVFRKLAEVLTIHLSYVGAPVSLTIAVRLSLPGGWHSSVPLVASTAFSSSRHDREVTLNLHDISGRVKAAADVTGLPKDPEDMGFMPTFLTPVAAASRQS